MLVIGSGGAGKSTSAAQLASVTGIPVRHLDALYWRSGWTPTPAAEWERAVDPRLAACDPVVFLDLPRAVCLTRVMRRALRCRSRAPPDMAPGCPERLTREFLRWIWRYTRDRWPGVLAKLVAARAACAWCGCATRARWGRSCTTPDGLPVVRHRHRARDNPFDRVRAPVT